MKDVSKGNISVKDIDIIISYLQKLNAESDSLQTKPNLSVRMVAFLLSMALVSHTVLQG